MTTSQIRNPAGERLDLTFHPGGRNDALVILGHGLTGDKDRPLLVALADGLSELGWPCMRISFSGSGESEGRFEEATITKQRDDLEAVLDTVPDYVRVIYAGHSMGSAVGVLTATRDPRIRLLVSLAGMTHTAAFVEREFSGITPGEGFIWDEPDFPLSEAFVSDLNAISSVLPAAACVPQPWLLIHGSADDVVPVQDSLDAYAAAVCQKQWLEIDGAGHSFDDATYPQVITAMHEWISSHLG